MFEIHPIFKAPDHINQKVWRYMDFTKFVDLISSKSLYFTRADYFEDIFEGSLTRSTVALRTKHFDEMIKEGKLNPQYTPEFWQKHGEEEKINYAINCWHMNDYESAAMWKLYLKSNEGIAIQSTYSNLISCINESNIDIQVGKVNYVDYENDFISYGNGFSAYVHKRKSFEHEKELRCVIWKSSRNNSKKVDLNSGGIKINLDLNKLVETIFVSPDSPIWFTNLVKDLTEKFDLSAKVINSRLNDRPIY